MERETRIKSLSTNKRLGVVSNQAERLGEALRTSAENVIFRRHCSIRIVAEDRQSAGEKSGGTEGRRRKGQREGAA